MKATQITRRQIHAAQRAENEYLRECRNRARRRSTELFGHPGASIASEAPSSIERVRRMLEAGLP